MGELLQHDTSYHLWSPLAQTKWYLITTIDDHSRRSLHGDLGDKESSWDPYRGSEGRADPIWLSVVNRDSDRNAKTSAHLLAFPFITYKLHELGHYGMGHQINSEFILATGQGISENDKR